MRLRGRVHSCELTALRAAISLDFYATASSGGASTWNGDWLEFFKGRTVYVCMDCDVAGQRAAERAAAAISQVAKEVCMVQLPYEIKESHGKDLHDYIVADGHGRKFLLLLDRAKKYVGEELAECGDDVIILEKRLTSLLLMLPDTTSKRLPQKDLQL